MTRVVIDYGIGDVIVDGYACGLSPHQFAIIKLLTGKNGEWVKSIDMCDMLGFNHPRAERKIVHANNGCGTIRRTTRRMRFRFGDRDVEGFLQSHQSRGYRLDIHGDTGLEVVVRYSKIQGVIAIDRSA